MKILYLHLKNFSHIYSGLGVRDIYLNFRDNTKVINVIIGKMGSCKTVILGHLQPFATFGTVDARNQDGVIIPGENGVKEITIRADEHEYQIVHTYTWTAGHHVLKSFMKEDETELNPSGSVKNFKLLVEAKLGLDQNMLTLLRLGPNVTNMIDLTAANRKSFMAGMLQDTEIYTMLYKKLNDDLRSLTSQISVMSNRLAKVSKGNIDHIRNELDKAKDQIRLRKEENEELQKRLNDIDVVIRSSTSGMSVSEFMDKVHESQSKIDSLQKEIASLQDEIEQNQSKVQEKSISDVLVKIGEGREREQNFTSRLMQLDSEYKEAQEKSDTIKENLLVSSSQDQIKLIQDQVSSVRERYDTLVEETKNYSYQYDSTTLRRLLGQIHQINLLINEISLYNPISVQDILQNGDKAVSKSKTKSEILMKLRIKLQRNLNNVEYLKQYKPEDVVFFPPDCPTHDCPYYKTHPVTVAAEMKRNPVDEKTAKTKSDLEKIEKELDRYGEYPILVSKIVALRVLWNECAPTLRNAHILITQTLPKIFSSLQSQVWYDHDLLMKSIELSEKHEQKNSLSLQLKDLEAQLHQLMQSDSANLRKAYEDLQEKLSSITKECHNLEEEIRKIQDNRNSLNASLELLMKNEKLQSSIDEKTKEIDRLQDAIDSQKDTIKKVESLRGKMEPILLQMSENEKDLKVLESVMDQHRLAIAEFESTSKDLQKVQEDQEILKYIVEAVSSSKGIPLVYIQLFLRSCKETLNELISDVFGDQLEVMDFIITQDEFKIPYSINGTMVDDIAKASQGQRSIISLALSFALIRQAMTKYNILLLDEMDGPLYVSDRSKFLDILYKQIAQINAEQIFLVSHNNTFDGHSVNIIMTTEEHVEDNGLITVMRVCDKE